LECIILSSVPPSSDEPAISTAASSPGESTSREKPLRVVITPILQVAFGRARVVEVVILLLRSFDPLRRLEHGDTPDGGQRAVAFLEIEPHDRDARGRRLIFLSERP
jgi:hypothetical protein